MSTDHRKNGERGTLCSVLRAVFSLVALLGFMSAPALTLGAGPVLRPAAQSETGVAEAETLTDEAAVLATPFTSSLETFVDLADSDDPEDDEVRPHEARFFVDMAHDRKSAGAASFDGAPLVPFRLLAFSSRAPPAA